MDALSRAVEELLGRASGPMHLRLILQPSMATFLAIRAGMRDARSGQSPLLWTFLTAPGERKQLAKTVWKDVGKIFVIALLLDTIYQIVALHQFRILQTLLVAVVLAILPYLLIRGPVTRIARASRRGKQVAPAKPE
jgi:hypothetical protein